ncbi:MAG: ABC transporter permease [Alphaproteobacteria bacterium]|nr:ABC transporter permease [Alphaproteobacteria bacterium]
MEIKTVTPRIIKGINTIGLMTLTRKEISRFLNVYLQTLVAPVITTLLFYTIFALAFGGEERMVGDIPFMQFLAPGLIMMTMVQNAFANTSSSLVIAKVQGNIVDVLMPPLSAAEILAGFVAGAVVRGMMVGTVTIAVMALFAPVAIYNIAAIIGFALLGNILLAVLGILGGIWSQKFDHIAAVTNFFITPMTFLSGTFYSIESLPGIWRHIAHYNPFFHMIDGFRYGFTGHADSDVIMGACILAAIDLALLFAAWRMLKTGYKIKS